ncbi:MAG: aminotransferase class III-fold pyridoxal phosphate-dependent enzyme, partial [Pseudomonadota bacterium]
MSETLLERRNRLLGPNLPTFYDEPVHLVRGEGVWVWDADGNRYLDCYNNVPHVGHCHPDVVDAICEQAGRLNTHTRYLHETIVEYAERLTDKFADPLSKLILTCTGSEANDIALRIAEAVTGKSGVIATDHTYHGNTTAVAALSTTNAPPEQSTSRVQHVSAPDSYRPPAQNHAEAFAEDIARAIHELDEAGCGFAALIVCPFFANEGFPALEPGFLDPALEIVRA